MSKRRRRREEKEKALDFPAFCKNKVLSSVGGKTDLLNRVISLVCIAFSNMYFITHATSMLACKAFPAAL